MDITERKRAEDALRQSREDLDRAQEVGGFGSWRLDVRRNILTWSAENHRIFGVPKGTPLTYETFLSTVHPDDREYVDTKWKAALRGEDYDIEHRIITGEPVKWVREKAYLEFDADGTLLGGFGITQDITNRKQAEISLRESEERFRLMAETSSELIFQLDLAGRVTYCSPAVRQFGYLSEEVIGKNFPDYVAPAYVPIAVEAFRQSIAGCRLDVFELSVRKKDGTTAIVEVSVAPIVHGGRTEGVQGIARDVTERKRIDNELRKARAELEIRVRERTAELLDKTRMLEASMREIEDLYNNAPCGYHSIDEDGVIVRINDTELRWLGYSRKEVVGKIRFAELMPPESLQVFEESFPILKRQGWVNDLDCTVIRRDGTPLSVLLNSTAIFDENGDFVMSRSTLFDITERREVQQKERAISELLKLFSKTFGRQEYLDSIVALIRQWCGCDCVGVRLAEKDGDFPYAASAGFSREFLKQEGCLTLGKDSCACTRVFQGREDSVDRSFTTAEGSFVCNDSSRLKHAKKSGSAAFRGACAAHGFVSLAVIPVRYRSTVKGIIHLADKGSNKFTEKLVALVESMTPLIGEALQRFDMESALKESREQLRSLSSHLQAAREEERLRLAREIHDELGQTLTAALMELGLLKKEVKKSAPAVEKIASVTGLIDEAVGDVQRICAELRPRILDHLGLRAALEWQTKKFADRTGINCLLDIPHDSIKLATETETALFRIFQETLTNVSRHAKATQVSVRLAIEDRALILEVRDNGTGISKSRLSAENAFGIMGIRERAHELGGDVIFTSARNKGTTVTVTVPHERRKTGA
jgi:PAS domain S-box-containing protein